MSNIVFATPAALIEAALSAGPTAPAGEVGRLLDREPSACVILTDPAQAWIQAVWPEPRPVRLAALLDVAASAAATWRVRAADDPEALTAAPTYDSGWAPYAAGEAGLPHRRFRRHDWLWLPAGVTARAWRIDILDPTPPDGRILIGNAVLDPAFQPEDNYDYGWSASLFDPSRVPRAVAGQRDPLNGRPYTKLRLTLSALSEAEAWGEVWDMDELTGTTRPLLVIRDPAATARRQRQAVWGLLSEGGAISNPYFGIHERSFELEELIP
jgi:hypothetical protein